METYRTHYCSQLNLNNLNAIEDVADDVLRTLAICGMKFHTELKTKFDKE